jgi:hypothetical protein
MPSPSTPGNASTEGGWRGRSRWLSREFIDASMPRQTWIPKSRALMRYATRRDATREPAPFWADDLDFRAEIGSAGSGKERA